MSTYQHACSAAGHEAGMTRLADATVGAAVRWYRFRRSLGMLRRLDGRMPMAGKRSANAEA